MHPPPLSAFLGFVQVLDMPFPWSREPQDPRPSGEGSVCIGAVGGPYRGAGLGRGPGALGAASPVALTVSRVSGLPFSVPLVKSRSQVSGGGPSGPGSSEAGPVGVPGLKVAPG